MSWRELCTRGEGLTESCERVERGQPCHAAFVSTASQSLPHLLRGGHEVLRLHHLLAGGRDGGRRRGHVARRRVDDGDGLALAALGERLVELGLAGVGLGLLLVGEGGIAGRVEEEGGHGYGLGLLLERRVVGRAA